MSQVAGDLVIPCPGCGTRNRVPATRTGDVPVCSDCKQQLLPDEPVQLGDADFERYVSGAGLPVLVDFWAEWCWPCQMMAPHFAAAVVPLRGKVLLANVDTDQNRGIAAQFAIQSIPTLVLLRSGKEVARQSGAMHTGPLVAWVEQYL
jgi:thioredoxin 2